MSTYKVIQDIEAEDHILGPLSLRQFIFAIVAVMCFYFCYLVITKHVAFLLILFLPPGLFAAFFAFPFGTDQPTEVWALAKIRFLFKPRIRIWDQSGVKNLVTVNAPKKIEEYRTNGLSQNEVRSRLSALADTIDSRGWAVKNVNVNLSNPIPTGLTDMTSDRLIDVAASMPQEVPGYDIQAADDIMDEQNNPIAQQFDQMISASAQNHRQQLVGMLNQPGPAQVPQPVNYTQPTPAPTAVTNYGQPVAPPNDYWFMNQPVSQPKLNDDQMAFTQPAVINPGADDSQTAEPHAADPTAEEQAIGMQLKARHDLPAPTYAHMKTILPLSQQKQAAPVPAAMPAPVAPNPAVQAFVDNNDLNIATIAREAERTNHHEDQFGDEEVVISLH